MVVVLPTPLTPMIRTTSGGLTATTRRGMRKMSSSSAAREGEVPREWSRKRHARAGLEAFAQLGRGFDAHVRHNEEFFQFVPEVGGQVAVAGEEGGEPFAELFTGPFQPLMQLEENAVAFILFVLKIESKGEAVLQFRTEVRHFFVFHARGPCGEVGDEGIGFVLRGSRAVKRKRTRSQSSSPVRASGPRSSERWTATRTGAVRLPGG